MRTILLTLLLLFSFAANAQEQKILTQPIEFAPHLIAYTTQTSSSGCTVGVHGCLLSHDFNGVASANVTSGFGGFPYRGRVRATFFDSGSNGTLVCTGLVIAGWDQFGYWRRETLTSSASLTEAAGKQSQYAYVELERVEMSGCSGGAANDRLRLDISPRQVGLQDRANQLHSVCFKDQTAGDHWHCSDSGAVLNSTGRWVTVGDNVLDNDLVRVIFQGLGVQRAR